MQNRLIVAKAAEVGREMEWEIEISRCKLFHTEWIKHKVLL